MPNKSKFGFGSSSKVEQAIKDGKLNQRDILFMDEDTANPKVGWVTLTGDVVVAKPDLSGVEAEISALEDEVATKVNAEEVDTKINTAVTDSVASANAYTDKKIEAAVDEHLTKKYEVANVPEGTLIDYRAGEIRIMCKSDAVFTKQNVGANGDANSFYCTFKVYAPSVDAVGYIEHLNGESDAEVLTDFSQDEYGRRYQPTWLALAKYDEATDTWTYYGANSSNEKYIGFDYQIDWYDANGAMIGSDSVRINLSNEECHFVNEPYYVGKMMKEVDVKIEERIASVESAYEIIEF